MNAKRLLRFGIISLLMASASAADGDARSTGKSRKVELKISGREAIIIILRPGSL